MSHPLDSVNGSFPGIGWLGGVHISVCDAVSQATVGIKGAPVFGALLDASGGKLLQVPSVLAQTLSGMQSWAVALTLPPGADQFGHVVTITIQ